MKAVTYTIISLAWLYLFFWVVVKTLSFAVFTFMMFVSVLFIVTVIIKYLKSL